MLRGLILVAVAALLTACGAQTIRLPDFAPTPAATPTLAAQLMPAPELSPAEVVKIQVEALKNNGSDDAGIEITFRFASPANKQITGPLSHFKQLVKDPAYRPMLNHKSADFGPVEIDGDTAQQQVTITENNGQATVYLFLLSKEDLPACHGCWLTDSVMVVPTRKQGLKQI